MEKGDQVEKIRTIVEDTEREGLIAMDEYVIEDGVVDVPGLDKTVPVRDGVKKIPAISATYKVRKSSDTLKFFQDWYYKQFVYKMTVIRTDGAGNEISREMWQNVELAKCHSGAYDASAPDTAKVMVSFLPEDIIPIGAE